MAKYGIKKGDIFIAASGGMFGHLVTDVTSFEYCDDIVTIPFTKTNGLIMEERGNRIDAFKLAQVRYYKPEVLPGWIPAVVLVYAGAITNIEG